VGDVGKKMPSRRWAGQILSTEESLIIEEVWKA
jgi:hypothetical protein